VRDEVRDEVRDDVRDKFLKTLCLWVFPPLDVREGDILKALQK